MIREMLHNIEQSVRDHQDLRYRNAPWILPPCKPESPTAFGHWKKSRRWCRSRLRRNAARTQKNRCSMIIGEVAEARKMAEFSEELAAYEAIRADLEASHMGKWALVYNKQLIDIYKSFELAAEAAVAKFGRGPYLIRQIGASQMTLPASVVYNVYG